MNKYLQELRQYYFDRDEFVAVFHKIFSNYELAELEIACQEHRCTGELLLYYTDGEFYIIHLSSGTIINWYKHFGRTNTCNKEGFGIADLTELIISVKESGILAEQRR